MTRSHLAISLLFFACGASTTAPPTTPDPAPTVPSATTVTTAASTAPTSVPANKPAPVSSVTELASRYVPLPGATGPVTVDYIVFEPRLARVWVPVGDTGSADVYDIATNTFTRVDGFKTAEREAHGKKRMAGPSSAAVGQGFVYVGNRATSEVCAVDEKTLKLGACLKLLAAPDGLAYVASVKEVWVTTPKGQSLTILDASNPHTLKPKSVIKMPGQPEGYALDEAGGVFYTNLEDKNQTLAVDLKTHTIKATWSAGCAEDGPRGVAVDSLRKIVFVACTSRVQVLDAGQNGASRCQLDTGTGVDNIEYVEGTRTLYVAAGKAAQLTLARLGDQGKLSVLATGVTAEGARNAVADANGNVYVVDSINARLLVFAAPK